MGLSVHRISGVGDEGLIINAHRGKKDWSQQLGIPNSGDKKALRAKNKTKFTYLSITDVYRGKLLPTGFYAADGDDDMDLEGKAESHQHARSSYFTLHMVIVKAK